MDKVLKLSDFLPPTPCENPVEGRCVVCGREGGGHKSKFSSNFTAYSLLQAGNMICPRCYTLLHDQKYRRTSWVLSEKGYQQLKRNEVIKTLLNPPEPPFAIYLTRTGKKQGYLHLVDRVSWDRENYFIAFDDQLIPVIRSELEEMAEIARKARELKFSKSELRGDIKVKHFEHRDLCGKILEFAGNPLWEVVVWAVE